MDSRPLRGDHLRRARRRLDALLRVLERLTCLLDDGCILEHNRRLVTYHLRWRHLVEQFISDLCRDRADDARALLGQPADLSMLLTDATPRAVLPSGYLKQVEAIAEVFRRDREMLTQVAVALETAMQERRSDGSSPQAAR